MELNLAWGKKVSENFREKINEICTNFNWVRNSYLMQDSASWLMACIAFESAETFSPTIKNAAGSGAVGLIQFMPATAKSLGTNTELLALLSATDQLQYVEKYFKPYAKEIKNLSDMYMAILYPKAIGKPDNFDLFVTKTKAYEQNKGLDLDKNSRITKLEASRKVLQKLEKGCKKKYLYIGKS